MADIADLVAKLKRIQDAVKERGARVVCEAASEEFLHQLQDNTPVLTGALRDSERVNGYTGGGTRVTGNIGTHLELYASFRETGGDIYPRHMLGEGRLDPYSREYADLALQNALGRPGAEEKLRAAGGLGFLRWEGEGGVHYSRHVHQEGSWYMRRTVAEAAAGSLDIAAQGALDELIAGAGG